MSKRILKVSLPEVEQEYTVVLDKLSRFLFNDNNILYFEEPIRTVEVNKDVEPGSKESTLGELRLLVLSYKTVSEYIPDGYSYLCTFEDNAKIRYFVYVYDSLSKIFGSFMKDFSFGGLF